MTAKLRSTAARLGNKIFKMYSSRPILFCAVTAILLEFYIESFSRHSIALGFEYIFDCPLTFICNIIIIFFTMAISLPLKRGFAMWTTAFTVWFAFGTANGIILLNRPSPFTFSDFLILPSVLEIFTVYLEIWQIILICIGILGAITGLVFLWIKCPKRKVRLKRDCVTLTVIAAVCALAIHLSLVFGVVTTDYSNLLDAYYTSGFPYSFSRSLFCRGIDQPEGYSAEEVYDILDRIDSTEANTSEEAFGGGEKPDIIFVQLESFFDIKAVKDVSFSEDPIPYFTYLKQNYPSGYLSVPLIGSGTANTEFEVLTAMNIDYFSPGEYPFIAALSDPKYACQSIATSLKDLGYSTHTMHNNTGTFYSRNEVYPNLGFDTFTPIEYMYNVEQNPLGWAKDMVLLDEINKTLSSTEGSDFVFAVSVQPHGAYPTEQTGEYNIKVSGVTNEEYHMYSYYVNQIKETDDFVRALTEYYSGVSKKTVIVFYGDHLPDLKLTENDLSRGDMYSTEYVVWSNYGLGQDSDAPEKLEAYQLSTYVFSLLSVDGGVMNGVHRCYSGGDRDEYEHVMRLIEYDALYGSKYCYRGDIPVPSAMNYGVAGITVTDFTLDNGTLTVRGTGFNKYSVVYIDGKRCETVYSPDGSLTVYHVRTVAKIRVFQETTDGTVLGTGSQ